MVVLEILKWLFATLSLIATLASLIRWDDWWIRIFDFPRIQIFVVNLISIVLFLSLEISFNFLNASFLILLLLALVYQGKKIYPYTPLAKKQVAKLVRSQNGEPICVLVSNVYTPNQNSKALIKLIDTHNPDLVLTLKSDLW